MQTQIDVLNDKVDKGFKEVNQRLDKVEADIQVLKEDVALIKSCPTIKKELKELKKN